jgi:hypothetical protein
VQRLNAEMAQQEAQWKEAYDVILAENNALKSSGSEALLASQWRQRYEVCLKEKEDVTNKLKMADQKDETADTGKYEMKYRDLRESFRLYRKKAKEIFESQQSGEPGVSRTVHETRIQFGIALLLTYIMLSSCITALLVFLKTQLQFADRSSEDSKLSYLKNLMVNYLTSDIQVREHMESAIGTVLQFTPEDISKIDAKKAESDYWGLF